MMRFVPLASVLLLLTWSPAAGAAERETLKVWPDEAPGASAAGAKEQWQDQKVTGVTDPTITVYRPAKAVDTGVAVIVCPGGGYQALMMSYEGEDVARWLNTVGVTGIVLKYRIATPADQPKWTLGVRDGQRAISLVRSKAKEWGIQPDKIGVLGFSAGGHLAIAASCNFEKRTYEAIDEVDKVSCRPDFVVSVYPGGVVPKNANEVSAECKPTNTTPPTFIVMSHADRVGTENAALYYLALKRAGAPSAELHVYATGAHGIGIKPSDEPHGSWPTRCLEWLRGQKLLPAKSQ
jgi:acetyl esterase/lipase